MSVSKASWAEAPTGGHPAAGYGRLVVDAAPQPPPRQMKCLISSKRLGRMHRLRAKIKLRFYNSSAVCSPADIIVNTFFFTSEEEVCLTVCLLAGIWS